MNKEKPVQSLSLELRMKNQNAAQQMNRFKGLLVQHSKKCDEVINKLTGNH